MGARVRSVNIGTARPVGARGRRTGIDKRAVERIEVRDPGPKGSVPGSGVVGDEVLELRHHGGTRQAVYAVAREELDHWERELGRSLHDGMFGENLTTEGLDVDAAVVGERWRVGEALLEVTGPRIPCATFAAWMGERGWVRRFAERGRSGAYLSVVEPGVIGQGADVEVLSRPDHGIGVVLVFRALMGDADAARRVVDARVLGPDDHADLERLLTRTSPPKIDQ